MRNPMLLALLTSLAATTMVSRVEAADNNPVSKKIGNEQIMERVQLIGVIAGGTAKNSGIAVIKDIQSGRTYAIKTGDNLPGVGHIRLQSVQRELAVFNAAGKEFHVRLAVGAYAQEADDEADLAADLNTASGPGLFEKWYGSKIGVGADLVESNSEASQRAAKTAAPEKQGAPLVIEVIDLPVSDDAAAIRQSDDDPVTEYLDHLTRERSRSNTDLPTTSSMNMKNENTRKKQINEALRNEAAE